jgi:hypothetical protein
MICSSYVPPVRRSSMERGMVECNETRAELIVNEAEMSCS